MSLLWGGNASSLAQEASWDWHVLVLYILEKGYCFQHKLKTWKIALFLNFPIIVRAYHSLFE